MKSFSSDTTVEYETLGGSMFICFLFFLSLRFREHVLPQEMNSGVHRCKQLPLSKFSGVDLENTSPAHHLRRLISWLFNSRDGDQSR
jgi:hypothetical protein